MIVAPSSALAIVEAIRDDPETLALLRSLIDSVPEQESPLAYTVRGLAQRTGRSPKAIRGAIHRGELVATRDGSRGYTILPEHAELWLRPATDTARPSARLDRDRRGANCRVMSEALASLDDSGASP